MKKRYPRGSILVMSIFFMLILFITASAFIVLLPVEHRASVRSEQLAQAGFAADSGISEGMVFISDRIAQVPAQEPMANGVYPSQAGRTRDMGNGWAYRWELVPDAQTFPNGSNPIRAYTIVSKAFYNGKVIREARAEVLQETLAEYAELFDVWPDNLVKGIRSTDVPAGGKVHVNDVLRLWIVEGNAFWSSPGDPIFDYGLTAVDENNPDNNSSPDGFLYYGGNWSGTDAGKRPYNGSGPIESRYSRLAAGGRAAMDANSQRIPLPENTFAMRDAAWGFQQGNPPNTNGVHFNEVDGQLQGLYVRGDVEEMELGFGGTQPAGASTVSYNNNSWVKIEQPSGVFPNANRIDNNQNWTVVSVDSNTITLPSGSILNGQALTSPETIPLNSTLVRHPDGTFDSYGSRLNGMVYVNGDINNLWGVNKGRRTIAVEGDGGSNNNDIYIGGYEDDSPNESDSDLSVTAGRKGLIQFGVTDEDGDGVLDRPDSANNVLGLIGRNVLISGRLKVNDRWDTNHTDNNPLYLYAVVLAGLSGEQGSYRVEDYSSGGGGWAYTFGSKIMVDAGAWGTTSGHGLVNGNSFYDEAAAAAPPPYFPSKPTFAIRSYSETPLLTGESL